MDIRLLYDHMDFIDKIRKPLNSIRCVSPKRDFLSGLLS